MNYACPSQPDKDTLAQYIYHAISNFLQNCDPTKVTPEKKEAIRLLSEHIMDNPPNAHFQLTLLNHIDPKHEVFQKGYVKPKFVKKKAGRDFMIEDTNGFYEGLPDCASARRAKIPGLTKAQKIQQKKEALAKAHRMLDEKL